MVAEEMDGALYGMAQAGTRRLAEKARGWETSVWGGPGMV